MAHSRSSDVSSCYPAPCFLQHVQQLTVGPGPSSPSHTSLNVALVSPVAFVGDAQLHEVPYFCDKSKCSGNCVCASLTPPGGMNPKDTPQFILLTHDDAVSVDIQLGKQTGATHKHIHPCTHPPLHQHPRLKPPPTDRSTLRPCCLQISGTANMVVRQVADGLKNSNGCNVAATWFTIQVGTDCALAKQLWAENHEIAAHTRNHLHLGMGYNGDINGESALSCTAW
jgi:hypothetical protein